MSQDLHLENIRREYSSLSLSRKELPNNPLEIVSAWIDQAIETKVNEPTAVIVGTATPEGRWALHLLHELRQPQGKANSRQPTRCPYFPLARTRATDSRRGHD